jgi:hypothetical protein
MPDFERLGDSLRLWASADNTERQWQHGYIAGKRRARIEVLIVVMLAAALATLFSYWHLITK